MNTPLQQVNNRQQNNIQQGGPIDFIIMGHTSVQIIYTYPVSLGSLYELNPVNPQPLA